jgi:protein TonB
LLLGAAATLSAALLLDARQSALPGGEFARPVLVDDEADAPAVPVAAARAVPDQCQAAGLPRDGRAVSSARAETSPATWLHPDDYPVSAMRAAQEGVSRVRYRIGVDGRVGYCSIEWSSGVAALDRAACAGIVRSARYIPAVDETGCPVPSTKSISVRWQLPED